ncbi:transglutaminase family protein [Lutispora thermophila]|uniref:Transglutaminase-like superfamily protein n=1 Tax=Lutispora thermophila DSM 19022 TaxID=1122184 RepID=A0A1M6FXY4_9FIRM|nr:transglutaminase domain-containing protein [Lutispora thermophila]SHJ02561.1 Transglutaminase-like superfamily protein [Lutispora thermophila DSM 19022]
MHKKNFNDIFFKGFLLFVMILAISMGIDDYFEFGIKLNHLIFYDIVLIIIITLIYHYPLALLWGTLLFIVTSIYMYYYHSLIFNRILNDSLMFMQWFPAYIAGYAIFSKDYAIPFLTIMMIFSGGVLGILVFSRINKLIITAIGIILFSFFWFKYVEKSHLYLMIYLFSSLLLHSYSLWDKKKEEWKRKSISVSISFYRSWLGCAVLLIGLAMMFMFVFPFNIRPLKINALSDFMVQTFPFITEWKNASEENYGYSFRFSLGRNIYKDKKLGGPVNFDGSNMLSIKGDLMSNLYLRGSVYDKYSGFNWSKSKRSPKMYDEEKVMNLPLQVTFRDITIEVKPERLVSSTIFNALYPVGAYMDDGKIFIDDDLEMYSAKTIGNGTSYRINIKIPLYSKHMLRNAKPDIDDNLQKLYLRLPSTISERTKRLVNDLTVAKTDAYDKAIAIQNYLRSNYKYTLEPQSIPEGKEFVDYFLFEGKEGYCTYFASSMVVMLRLAGIPARYVEGFLIQTEGEGYRTYNVVDSNSHAWVEAYLGEYGWVTFEPTPAYDEINILEQVNIDDIHKNPHMEGDALKSISDNIINTTTRRKDILEDDIYTGTDLSKVNKSIDISIKHTAYVIAFLLVVLRVLYGLIRINMIKFINFNESQESAYLYIKHILWLLGKSGIKKKESETLRQLLMSLCLILQIDRKECEHILSIIEGIIYGGKTIEIQEVVKLKDFEKELKKNIKEYMGEIKYIWHFYFGKI